jgi:hypothetical protein
LVLFVSYYAWQVGFCFLQHSVLALRETFFIVVLKWALFDWSCVHY